VTLIFYGDHHLRSAHRNEPWRDLPHMLILTRRIGEVVAIGDDIRLTVLGIRGNQVRMGVKAPADVAVHREEIYKRVQAERREAAAQSA